jgi:hypothetical protein
MPLSAPTPASTLRLKIFHFSRCGDGVCDGPETAETCPQDCGKDYEVVSITTLTTEGGRMDWSHDGRWIYYDHLEPDGFWDVYRIHPDSTGNECITCDRPELSNNNQGQPQMHPDGRYLVFQAEKAEHEGTVGGPATGPGGGYFNDLWALDLETGSFHQLTDVRPSFPAGGSLHSHFSNDGAKLLWSDLERYDGRFGDWQLAVANFVTFVSLERCLLLDVEHAVRHRIHGLLRAMAADRDLADERGRLRPAADHLLQ